MIINRALLDIGKKEHFSEDVDFSTFVGDENHCKKISFCHVDVDALELDDVLILNIDGAADVIASCKYTLEDVPLKVKFKEEMVFSNKQEDESSYYEPGVEINLYSYILALILDKVPHTVVKKGASKPNDGVGYRILTEDELNEEKKNKKDSRWDKLDEIKI